MIDSGPATRQHISDVRMYLMEGIGDLLKRYWRHDASKLLPPEKAMFDEYTERLHGLDYGTPEYEAVRQEMLDTALAHHYEHNDHHPEHFANGYCDMNLMQVLEMLADWKAATLRHATGDLAKSIRFNAERFGYGADFERLLFNTARDLGWL